MATFIARWAALFFAAYSGALHVQGHDATALFSMLVAGYFVTRDPT